MKKINKRGMTSTLAVIMTIACMTNSAISASAYDSAIAAAGGAAIAAINAASGKGSSGAYHSGGGGRDEYVYDGSIASGDYTKSNYVVPKNDGMLWAKDTFEFTVSKDGTVSLDRVKQKTSKMPILNFEPNRYKVVESADKWIKVETYWKSNKEISVSIPAKLTGTDFDMELTIPALKDVTCVYKIYADGTLQFVEKYW